MGNRTFNLSVGSVDLDALDTEDDFEREARRLLPEVLRQVGEASATTMWEEMQKAVKAPGFKVSGSASEKQRFIREAGQKYQREASATDRQAIEADIVKHLREAKGL
jgi:hypothetical protein